MEKTGEEVCTLQELSHARTHANKHLNGTTIALCLKCAVELGIPDAIHAHGQPISLSRLVSSLSIPTSKAPFLRRLMRLLAHTGYFTIQPDPDCTGQDAYSLTPNSQILLKDSPTSFDPVVLFLLDSTILHTSNQLSTSLRGGCRREHVRAHPFG